MPETEMRNALLAIRAHANQALGVEPLPAPAADEWRCEVAACLWEALLNLWQKGRTHPTPLAHERAVVEWLDGEGFSCVRMTVIGWTDECAAAWELVSENFEGCFDWDFVPDWLVRKLTGFLEIPS